ncbi:WD40-repeat-containing domain protein [Thamnocephalis sphaerospora]|uniref:WD40-repeat-containing domain protein n=1 Tax=Thamnocephalis sphaerospora TaxID=78915 RepID=A0A4P9XSA1_9FUNG|nr:WD40-repeat-containing domain protein [Thamnocephalis sphaerospora]|eukprot:RKP08995.1 WD40-repeat-containing domain protein [Thamnocephalis sphaerospora]
MADIDRLPDELLVRIFVLLDPQALEKTQCVCKRWHRMVADDRHWRDALVTAFGRQPFRRLVSTSWRSEYIGRIKQIRRWSHEWAVSVEIRPRVAVVSHCYADLEANYMLVGNVNLGIAIQCDPTTGKVNKRGIQGCPEDDPTMARCMLFQRGRILWGYRTGTVALTQLDRGTATRRYWMLHDSHAGAVSCLAWSPAMNNMVASGGVDGTVRIWDTATRACTALLRGVQGEITLLAFDARSQAVACTDQNALAGWSRKEDGGFEELPSLHLPLTAKPTALLLMDRQCAVAVGDRVLVVSLNTGTVDKSLLVPARGLVTCLKWARSSGILCCGYSVGTVAAWETAALQAEGGDPPPLWTVEAHEGPVTSLAIDACKVASASTDGTVTVWDVLTAVRLRTFGIGDDEEALYPVVSLYMSNTALLAVFGGKAKCWRFGANNTKPSKDKKGRGRRKMSYDSMHHRLELMYEVQEEMRETASRHAQQREDVHLNQALASEYGSLGDLTEEELLHYTMMLSLEETGRSSARDSAAAMYAPSSVGAASAVDAERATSSPDEESLLDQEERDLIRAVMLSTLPDEKAS